MSPTAGSLAIARRAASTVTARPVAVRLRPCIVSSKSLGFRARGGSGSLLSSIEPSGPSRCLYTVVGQSHRCHPFQSHSHSHQVQVRWQSRESQEVKSVGFEDVNASLRTDNNNNNNNPSPSTKPVIIDVREPAELSSTGKIPGAVSIPLASEPDAYFLSPEEFETRFGYPKPPGMNPAREIQSKQEQEQEQEQQQAQKQGGEKEGQQGKDIIFYCKAGVRARAAAHLAVQAGYDPKRIGVYDGSWLDWVDKGGKVERWEGDE